MITKVQAYSTASGVFQTIEEAQGAELRSLWGAVTTEDGQAERESAVNWIMEKKDAILDILTMTASSKPRARKINGGKKTRKTSPAPNPNLAGIDR